MTNRHSNFFAFLILLCIFIGCAYFYMKLPFYVFVQDESWKELGLTSEFYKVRWDFLMEKKGFRVVNVHFNEKTEPELLKAELLKAKGAERIVINPVVATACNLMDINLKELFEGSEIIAITRDNSKNYFDKILVPDSNAIWDTVYDYIGDASNVKICSTARELSNYLSSVDFSSNFHVIVDFKLTNAVPKNNLAGVVVPDFMDSFKREFKEESEDLEYIFRMTKMDFEYSSDTNLNKREKEKKGGLVQKVL